MHCVEKMALNAKVTSSSLGDKMLAVSSGELGIVHTTNPSNQKRLIPIEHDLSLVTSHMMA